MPFCLAIAALMIVQKIEKKSGKNPKKYIFHHLVVEFWFVI